MRPVRSLSALVNVAGAVDCSAKILKSVETASSAVAVKPNERGQDARTVRDLEVREAEPDLALPQVECCAVERHGRAVLLGIVGRGDDLKAHDGIRGRRLALAVARQLVVDGEAGLVEAVELIAAEVRGDHERRCEDRQKQPQAT